MFTDLAGYTSLSQQNESLALELLDRHRELVRAILPKHRGREVKTIGDAFLVEFASALEAVRCAFDIQQAMQESNDAQTPVRRILARIGVHVGDVVGRAGDIHGDAVNIASRVEPLAEPGGICITEQVFAQVRNKLEFPMVPMGPQKLKNVDIPTEVFRVVLPWGQQTSAGPPASKTRIAVLPFANISPDPNDEYFADGLTEELINTISHNQKLKVIARTSVGRYKGSPKSISDIGKEIGVGSVLEGSVRKTGNKIRVTAQLIDAATEEHVWSDNYDRQLDDIFSIQSDIAKSVSEALRVRLVPEDRESVEKVGTRNPAAHVHYLRGRVALRGRAEDALTEARKFFEDAIAEDGNYAAAYAGLADALYLLAGYGFMPMGEAKARGRDALDRALSLDENLPEAHTTLAFYLQHDYEFAEAESEFRRAISLNKNYVLAHHWYSILLLEAGRVEEAREETLNAEDLDPLSPIFAYNAAIIDARLGKESESQGHLAKLKQLERSEELVYSALSYLSILKGDLASAVAFGEDGLKTNSRVLLSTSALGLAYGATGKRDKASEMLNRLNSLPEGTFGKPFFLALVYGGLGEKDEMFKNLDKAFEEHSIQFRILRYWYSAIDPTVKKDPRYSALFTRAGLNP
jgi:adenylate cyclase